MMLNTYDSNQKEVVKRSRQVQQVDVINRVRINQASNIFMPPETVS